MPDSKKALVSACLVGFRCRYDGRDALRREIRDLYDRGELVAVCPEELGGLGTPRPPAEIILADPPGAAWTIPSDLGALAGTVETRGAAESAPALGESDLGAGGADVWEGRARVVAEGGRDVTRAYIDGAIAAARRARDHGVGRAYLKARSPSCGRGTIVRGGRRVAGDGVTAYLLSRLGIEVVEVD